MRNIKSPMENTNTVFSFRGSVVRRRVLLMSLESVSTLELEEEIQDCLIIQGTQTLILPTNQCIPVM